MAKYSIEIKRSAVKEINKIPKQFLQRIIAKIKSLDNEPRPKSCNKLLGKELYRIRVGQYRIVYQIVDTLLIIYIVKIGHKKNIYKQI